ncbi:unnamed protein product [Ceutorhynchus assimilis]|uniref:Uncharacterized protein n=1 Tax=Ceutorhynchus assimilis TaxID=467358 RepID=A0A9N9MZQ8_9CUCU|nr:unnamed protein product [Ceutorhynchus assimilis]
MIKKCLPVLCLIIIGSRAYNSDYRFYHRERVYDLPQRFDGEPPLTRTQWLCFVLGICTTTIPAPIQSASPNLRLISQWNQLEFDYATLQDRQHDIDIGLFTPGTIAPIDVDVFYSPNSSNNEVFVTIPRFVEGIPATLGTVTSKQSDGNPVIKPYPNWSWHRRSEECHRDRIVSVFRVKVDECGRLWVLDTGKIGEKQLCSPQLLAFDLNTNQLVHRHEFPADILPIQHLLVTPEVDVRDPNSGCRDTFVYSADVVGFSLLVHDVANGRSWRVQDKTFYPYPNYGTYNIAGESFELMDGILGLSLSPHIPGDDRVLFYHAMSSPTENYVYTSYLRNRTIFEHDPSAAPQIFQTFPNQRTTQVASEAIDKDGVMFFGLMKDFQIACWNARTDYGPKNFDIVASDPITLQFPSGIKIIRNKRGQQELWILTSRFQKVATGSLNSREPNFRIQAGNVEDLLYGTKCRPKQQHHNQVGGGGYGLYGHGNRLNY